MGRIGGKAWLVGLVLALAWEVAAQEPERSPTGTVMGTVRTDEGLAVVRAEVSIDGTTLRAVTRDDGSFSIGGVPAGTVGVSARRSGYASTRREVNVPVNGTVRVELALARALMQMAAIVVTARGDPSTARRDPSTARRHPSDVRLAGFRERSRKKAGGYYITRARIEKYAGRSVYDILRAVPGVQVGPQASQRFGGQPFGSETVRLRGANCPPGVFIDGAAATAEEFDLGTIALHLLEGIEVHPSNVALPPEFFAAGVRQHCGVIAIWSLPPPPRALRGGRQENEAEVERARASAMTLDQVDIEASVVGGTPVISYPDSLWRTATGGHVTLEFVVDERGVMNWSTLRVVEETHPLFTYAVYDGLTMMEWQPARVAGRAVPQLVVLPVTFSRTGG